MHVCCEILNFKFRKERQMKIKDSSKSQKKKKMLDNDNLISLLEATPPLAEW